MIFYATEWALRVVMLLIISRQKRHASAALAWIAFTFAAPWLVTPIYIIFGTTRLARRRINTRREATGGCAPEADVLDAFEVERDALKMLPPTHAISATPMLLGNAAEFIAEDAPFLTRLEADIDSAQHHVHLLFFIYGADDTGRRIGDALIRAAKRGVSCRVLVDGVGSRRMLRRLAPTLRAGGVEVREALPVGFTRFFFARVDLRNHRKLVVVDGHIAYTGSRNLLDAGGTRRKPPVWRDAVVRLRGPITHHLQAVFLEDWGFEGPAAPDAGMFPPAELAGDAWIQSVPSGPIYETQAFSHLIVTAIHAAREQVTLTTPYFIPDAPLLLALQVAALRGVHVRLICPLKSDQAITTAAGRAYYRRLLQSGVQIFHHKEGILHTKCLSVDRAFAVFGSGNLDPRSFYLNFELNLLLAGEKLTDEVLALQSSYIERSVPVDPESWSRRGVFRRLGEDLSRLLSPLL